MLYKTRIFSGTDHLGNVRPCHSEQCSLKNFYYFLYFCAHILGALSHDVQLL